MALLLVGYVELLALAILCYLFLLQWRRNRNEIIWSWPVLGMLPEILRNVPRIHDYAAEILRRSGGTLEFKGPWLSSFDFIITSDPRNVQHILNTNFTNYPKGPEFQEMFEPLGDGIFNSDFDLWKSQRKLFHQLLMGQSKFESFIAKTIQTKVIEDLIPDLDHAAERGIQVDLQKLFHRLTFGNSSSLVFGLSPISPPLRFPTLEYQKAFQDMEEAIWHRHLLPVSWWKLEKLVRIGCERKLKRGWKVFDEFLRQSIASKREEFSRGRSADKTLIDQDGNNINGESAQDIQDRDMITAYLEEGKKRGIEYSDKFLRDTAFNFMVAGMGSVNASITWFFWLVGTHPRAETKILEEMRRNLPRGNKSGIFSPQELSKLVYLHAAFCEALRLYPPLPLNHKVAAEPDTLPSGHRVKRNSRVLMSFYAMGRAEEIWGKECLEFKPERWISAVGEILYAPPYKFTAFNAGPRYCLGKDMSFVQMKTVATAVLWNYSVGVVEGHPVSPRLGIVLQMKHGLEIRVSKRSRPCAIE